MFVFVPCPNVDQRSCGAWISAPPEGTAGLKLTPAKPNLKLTFPTTQPPYAPPTYRTHRSQQYPTPPVASSTSPPAYPAPPAPATAAPLPWPPAPPSPAYGWNTTARPSPAYTAHSVPSYPVSRKPLPPRRPSASNWPYFTTPANPAYRWGAPATPRTAHTPAPYSRPTYSPFFPAYNFNVSTSPFPPPSINGLAPVVLDPGLRHPLAPPLHRQALGTAPSAGAFVIPEGDGWEFVPALLPPAPTTALSRDADGACAEPAEAGPCSGQMARWSAAPDGTCTVFLYSGCGGNRNRFATQAACLAACGLSNPTPAGRPWLRFRFPSSSQSCPCMLHVTTI